MSHWKTPLLFPMVCAWLASALITQARPSISDLESRRSEIKSQLSTLSYPSLNTGVAPIGYRSNPQDTTQESQWVTIRLSEAALIDQITLIAPICRSNNHGFKADAFPQALRIFGKSPTQDQAILLKDFPNTNDLLPRIAPVVIPINPPQKLTEITIEATHLGRQSINNDPVFQLAEVLLFSGKQNVALRQQVVTPDRIRLLKGWNPKYLVDGIVPYLMDSSRGESSTPFVSVPNLKISPILKIDLGEQLPIDSLRLHAVDQGDTLPQTYAGDFGLPRHFILESAPDATFSTTQTLLDTRLDTAGPILSWKFPPIRARHLRLRVVAPYLDSSMNNTPRFGLAELELLSGGQNLLLGKKIDLNIAGAAPFLTSELLTDGKNIYGSILPIRQWIEELALRHELENELALLEKNLSQRYTSQKKTLQIVFWSFVLATLGFILISLYSRLRRIHHEIAIRERIASNLHDDLGANLHSLGLLGKLVEQSIDKPDRLKTLAHRIHTLTHQTGNATRDCSNMLRNKNLHDDLLSEMRRQAQQLLADLSYQFEIEEEALLQNLSRRTRIDLQLYFKEALTNIIRHSHAENVRILLQLHRHWGRTHLTLDIHDNGLGISAERELPRALSDRAKLLKAKLISLPHQETGTHLRLSFSRFTPFNHH